MNMSKSRDETIEKNGSATGYYKQSVLVKTKYKTQNKFVQYLARYP